MKYKKLGRTDINVSVICTGCWNIAGDEYWGKQEKADSIAALKTSFNEGINFFDTAEGYGEGYSEQLINEALSEVKNDIVIASKVSPDHFKKHEVIKACERSLKNLNRDYIDLYQLHWPNHRVQVFETIEALEVLQNEGKIREYGVSNYGVQDLSECFNYPGQSIITNQLAYNLLFRAIEFEIIPLCEQENIAVLPYSPLMQGLLTGKFMTKDMVPEARIQTRHFSKDRPLTHHSEDGAETEVFEVIGELSRISKETGISVKDLSLGWLLSKEIVASVIVGARNKDQACSNAKSGDIIISADIISELDSISAGLKNKLGNNADLWLSRSRIR